MAIDEADVPFIMQILSAERLAVLTQLTGNAKSAIELHQETLRLGANLLNVIASIEIALRNSICENLGQFFGAPGWLISPPPPFQWRLTEKLKIAAAVDSARRAEYAKLSQAEKHALDGAAFPNGRPANLPHLSRAKKRRTHISVTDGKVIAELTFYIWKRIYGPDYEHSLWRPTLKKTFPDKKLKRADIAAHLEILYQARNRLAHHEPVLHRRFDETMTSIAFIAQRLGMEKASEGAPLAGLVVEDFEGTRALAEKLHAELNSYRI
ncbi:hypothetical protein [Pelagibacterium sp.]|uniref:hypothetical protein n=1 Tax=Pelagibacterium sp. TaxID=1967288 RepID=UPI003BACE9B4